MPAPGGLNRSRCAHQCDGVLRASLHAQATCAAQIRAHGERLLVAVRKALDPSFPRELSALRGGQCPDLEDIIGTDFRARRLALAPVPIDTRDKLASALFAFKIRAHAYGSQPRSEGQMRLQQDAPAHTTVTGMRWKYFG